MAIETVVDENGTPALEWDAFQYVAGEMSVDESRRFESILDHDQAAREAVAEVVALVNVIAHIDDVPRPAVASGRRWAGSWPAWLGIAAACALLIAAWLTLHSPEIQTTIVERSVPPMQDDSLVEVALVWAQVRESFPDEQHGSWPDFLASDSGSVPETPSRTEESSSESQSDTSGDFDPPKWLLSAMALSSGDMIHGRSVEENQ